MLKLTALVLISSLSLLASPAHADKDFMSGTGATYDCGEDGSVNIVHDGGTYTLTGECTQVNVEGSNVHITVADVESLAINGNGNVVRAATVGTILINGDQNTVHWRSAKTGRRPTVATNGEGNSVARSQ